MTEIFAHRGLHQIESENTVPAFLAAKAVGADGVELDVRRTRDGALVVHHDAAIENVGAISELACRDLPPSIATFEQVMTACEGLRVNVEIKNLPTEAGYDPTDALARQVINALDEWKWLGRVIISSFDLETCEAARRVDAEVEIGWLLDWRKPATPAINRAVERGLNAIHPYFSFADQPLLDLAHERGIAVNVWTVNAPADIARMVEFDVDSVITDDPALALKILLESEQAG